MSSNFFAETNGQFFSNQDVHLHGYKVAKKPTHVKPSKDSNRRRIARNKLSDRSEALALGLSWPEEYCEVMEISYELDA